MEPNTQHTSQLDDQVLTKDTTYAKLKPVFFISGFIVLSITAFVTHIISLPFRFAWRLFQITTDQSTSDDLKLAITVHQPEGGNPDQQPRDTLLLVHGFPDSSALWDPTVAHLVKLGYRCLVVDLPASQGKLPTYDVTFEKVAKAIHDAVLHTGIQKVSIIAHDLGVLYTLLLTSAYPEMVSRLVVLDVTAGARVTPADGLCILAYQLHFAVCYYLGNPLGSWGVRLAAFLLGYNARPLSELTADMVWPFPLLMVAIFRKAFLGKRKQEGAMQLSAKPCATIPTLFAYGTKKVFFFHDVPFLSAVRSSPSGKVEQFDSDHWFFYHLPQQWLQTLTTWLDQSESHLSQTS